MLSCLYHFPKANAFDRNAYTRPQRHQPLRHLHCPAPVEYHAYIRLFLQYAHNYLQGYVKTCYK